MFLKFQLDVFRNGSSIVVSTWGLLRKTQELLFSLFPSLFYFLGHFLNSHLQTVYSEYSDVSCSCPPMCHQHGTQSLLGSSGEA